MDKNENFSENMKILFFSVLYKWKLILIIALVCGILLGGVQSFQAKKGVVSAEPQLTGEEKSQLESQQYWTDVAEQNYLRQQEYMEGSILMQMDYRQVYQAAATYYIDTGYQIRPDSVYQDVDHTETLVAIYQKYVLDPGLQARIAKELGTEPRFVQEIIQIDGEDERSLSIIVRHYDQEAATKIISLVHEELAAAHETLKETVCPHSMTKLLDSVGVCVDVTVRDAQRISEEKLAEYRDNYTTQQDALNSMRVNFGIAVPGTAGNNGGTLKTFVKWAVLGGIIGGMLAVLLAAMAAVFSDKLTSEKKITCKFAVNVLGTLSRDKRRSTVAAWLRKREGRRNENTEENTRYIAENLLNHVGDGKTVLVCGEAEQCEAETAVAHLQKHIPDVKLIAAGSLSRDAEALKQLRSADALVLVVTLGASSGKGLTASLKKIQQMEKNVAGIVVMD